MEDNMGFLPNIYTGSNGTSRATRNAIQWNREADRRRAESVPTLAEFQDEERQEAEDHKSAVALAVRQADEAREDLINREVTKRTILTAPDSNRWVDPEYATVTMPWTEANAFNEAQVKIFMNKHPEFPKGDDSVSKLGTYFSLNGINVVSAAQIEHAYKRLTECGLLSPVSVSVTARQPAQTVQARQEVSQPVGNDINTFDWNRRNIRPNEQVTGYDDNGKRVTLSVRQIEALSADEYRTFAKI
jgi:hypothetical protein